MRSFDNSTNKIEIFIHGELIKESVIVTLLIISALFTYFSLAFNMFSNIYQP